MHKTFMRTDVERVRCYAAGDGNLSFVAEYAEGPKKNRACPAPPTRDECEHVCPTGWVLYEEGPNWRAKPVEPWKF